MDSILSLPSRAYDHVYGQYGTIGLIVVGLLIVVGCIGVYVWFDRRK